MYGPRPGTPGTIPEYFAIEQIQPVLGAERLKRVTEFESQLYNSQFTGAEFPQSEAYTKELEALEASGIALRPLEGVWRDKVNRASLGVSYFLTDTGRKALYDATGHRLTAETEDACTAELSMLDIRNVDSGALDILEGQSIEYEEQELTQAFIRSGFDGSAVRAPHIIRSYKNPEILAAKARDYQHLKAHYRCIAKELRVLGDADPEVLRAKLFVVDLYRRRVNRSLDELYVGAYGLLSQHRNSGGARHREELTQLEEHLPGFDTTLSSEEIAGRLQRFDRHRHGVSRDQRGRLTWLSPEAEALVERDPGVAGQNEAVDRGEFTDIPYEALAKATIKGETYGDWIASVLQSYGLLSASTEWFSEREGPAADDLWQAVVDGKFKSLAVSDKQRIVKIPEKSRSVAQALWLASHELTHALQHANKRSIARLAIQQVVGIDAVSDQVEAGALWQERVAREAITGYASQDTPGTGYYRALQVKARGGSYGECVQAYFEDLLRRNPKMEAPAAAGQAVNRARRIFRNGGLEYAQHTAHVTNTQVLSYLEQRLIYEALPEQQRPLLFIGSVSISSLVTMTHLGLVDVSKLVVPQRMPHQLLHDAAKEVLAI
ncbi:MAG TPA: hypothetical protein VFT53_05095 [Candidatus Saccharimonadales bacterium]|nr:hypothetical protein [Candidatus Saccharimonadales bacterium]